MGLRCSCPASSRSPPRVLGTDHAGQEGAQAHGGVQRGHLARGQGSSPDAHPDRLMLPVCRTLNRGHRPDAPPGLTSGRGSGRRRGRAPPPLRSAGVTGARLGPHVHLGIPPSSVIAGLAPAGRPMASAPESPWSHPPGPTDLPEGVSPFSMAQPVPPHAACFTVPTPEKGRHRGTLTCSRERGTLWDRGEGRGRGRAQLSSPPRPSPEQRAGTERGA